MDIDAKEATEGKVEENEESSSENSTQQESDANADESTNESQDQQFIPKERFDQVNERMKSAEEARRRSDSEIAQLRADMAAIRNQSAPTETEPMVNPEKDFEGKPVEFVEHFTKKVEARVDKKFKALEGENKNLKFQLQVQDAAGRLDDFNDYREEIIALIHDPNFRAINPNEPGAIDLYYTVARDRRAATGRAENVHKSAPKVPHTESSRKRTRPTAKDPRDMSLSELREHIGTVEQ